MNNKSQDGNNKISFSTSQSPQNVNSGSDELIKSYIAESVEDIKFNRSNLSGFYKFAFTLVTIYLFLIFFIVVLTLFCCLCVNDSNFIDFMYSKVFLIFVIGFNVSFITTIAVLGKILAKVDSKTELSRIADKMLSIFPGQNP